MRKFDHSLKYIDMHPQPVEREPNGVTIVLGACLALAALFAVTCFLFSL